MTIAETEIRGDADDREIVSRRHIDHSPERVFSAWIDPLQLAQWWGPKGFRNTFETFEPRPGGHWRFVMHGPDGSDYDNHSIFVDIEAPRRIVFDHVSGHVFRITATLEPDGEGTLLTWRMAFESAEECARIRAFVSGANEENLDRLEQWLAKAP